MVLSKKEIGHLVKEARKIKADKLGKKYTQVMLASDIKKSQGYIGDIESGRTYPTFNVLSQIAEVCEVPLNFFTSNDELVKYIIRKEYRSISEEDVEGLSRMINRYNEKLPEFMPYIGWDLSTYKDIYDQEKNIPADYFKFVEDDDNSYCGEITSSPSEALRIPYSLPDYTLDIKQALSLILEESNLILNDQPLSDNCKTALLSAIELGLKQAEQIQRLESEK